MPGGANHLWVRYAHFSKSFPSFCVRTVADVVHSRDSEWQDLPPLFGEIPGARQIFKLKVDCALPPATSQSQVRFVLNTAREFRLGQSELSGLYYSLVGTLLVGWLTRGMRRVRARRSKAHRAEAG